MKRTGTAYFVDYPRILQDLQQPHLIESEHPYEIVKTIVLAAIDYENFCTDMIADRQFIEDNADLCGTGEIWKCLFVHQRGKKDGILIVPMEECHVEYAAYLPD